MSGTQIAFVIRNVIHNSFVGPEFPDEIMKAKPALCCRGRLEVDEKLQSGTHPQQPSPPAPIADEGATSGTSPQDPVTKCQQFIIRVERLSEKRISERISNRKRPLPDKEEEKAQTPDEEDTTTGDGDRNYDEEPLSLGKPECPYICLYCSR